LYVTKVMNVYERWKLMLDLVIKDDGSDQFIESNHGKLFWAPAQEVEDLDDKEIPHKVDNK
jgi:hypothetical protein